MDSSSERRQDGGHTASVQLVISQESSHISFGQPSSEQGGLDWAVMKEIPKCPHSPCNLNDIRKSSQWLSVAGSLPPVPAPAAAQCCPTVGLFLPVARVEVRWWTVGDCGPVPDLFSVSSSVRGDPFLFVLSLASALCLETFNPVHLRLTSTSQSFCLGLSSARITGCLTLCD